MKLKLSDKNYTYLVGYQKDQTKRAALNILVKKIFGISFEDWFQAGYWNEKYIPYTLFDGDKAVANISVNIMDFDTFGDQKRFIQIGTVLTDTEYRNQNLSKFLMENVLEEWKDKCNFIYLYANKTVLEMYPKYGFRKVKEYEYFKSIRGDLSENAQKLNMEEQSNRELLYDYARNSAIFAKISMKENADLVMFYCTSFLKDNIYYINSLDVIAIATFRDNQLHLWDVFGKIRVDLDQIIVALLKPNVDQIILGFTPLDCNSYEVREVSGDDTLFIQQGKANLFDENKIMFPLLSHA